MQALRNLLEPSRLTSIVDVGANPIDDAPPYTRMLDEGLCTVVGFDPQVTASSQGNRRMLPYVISSDDGVRSLNVAVAPGMTSLLPLNEVHAAAFPMMPAWGAVLDRRTVETKRLDNVCEIDAIDFLKMDVQGAEIDVLRGGRHRLTKAVAVMTEVSFVTLYRGQSTFGEMDTELRHMGFIPHCFAAAKCWPIATTTIVPNMAPHQLLEADVVYVRDFTRTMGVEQWKHLAMIAHHVCGSFDLAMRCVEALAKMEAVAPSAPDQYRQILEAM